MRVVLFWLQVWVIKMDTLYWGAVAIFAIGWYIEQRMYVDGHTRRKRDPYKPIDYLGMSASANLSVTLYSVLLPLHLYGFPTFLLGCPTILFKLLQPCGWL